MNYCESIGLNLAACSLPPMSTMAERLQEALDRRGMTPPQVISATKLSKGAVYNILNGTTRPEKIWGATAKLISQSLGISTDWLISGRGSMDDVGRNRDEGDWEDVTAYAQAVGLGAGAEAQEYAETHALKFKASSLRKRGIYGRNLAVYYGKGDSMEPTIKDGDAIMFDKSDQRPLDGCLYVVQRGNEVYVKRAELLGDDVYFRSDNPHGDHNWRKPVKLGGERNPLTVLGRVHWIGSWAD